MLSKVYAQEFDSRVDRPIGQWNCVLYGNPMIGDERSFFSFGANNILRITRTIEGAISSNSVDLSYEIEGNNLSFYDTISGRTFNATLGGRTLSGEWRTRTQQGGWWCSPAGVDEGIFSDAVIETYGRRLDVEVMASPSYPVQAIREVTQGRVVICFEVTTLGEIINPNFIEVSDEVFRAPSLDALVRSKYRSWLPMTEDEFTRPACRSFIYRLDYVYR